MYLGKSVAVVIPCHNEATQITRVLDTLPEFVDAAVAIDDCSTDATTDVIKSHSTYQTSTHLIAHTVNLGVGGAIASGYKWCLSNDIDIAVVMAGDGQMNPDDLSNILHPVATGKADYSKGNRLVISHSYKTIPFTRFFGNTVLSFLTKVASGYWHVSDSQTGYTAINRLGLRLISWDKMYKRYGQPNDLLVRLNVADLRVIDVPTHPVYNVGEQSGIRVTKVIPPITMLLLRLFFWRLKEKYVIRGLHPLVFFYALSFISAALSVIFFIRCLFLFLSSFAVPEISLLLLLFSATAFLNSLFMAMFLDYQDNKDLNPRISYDSLERYFK